MAGDEQGSIDFQLDLTGQTLDGRWKVEAVIGKGGMGTVYRALDLRLSRIVVVKVPHPRFLAEEGARERFEREVRSLLTLEHPHVVKVHDVGAYRGVPFVVLQYLPGGSLSDRIEAAGGRITPSAALAWLPSVAEALDFVHARGVVHRDVKPGNVLFDEAGHAYLADFGIAKALGGADTGLTQTGMTPGSPNYMAPESVVGTPAGPLADQYALASLLYEALSGRLPFPGSTAIEILVAKQMDCAPPLAVEGVPMEAAAAVMRALERDPAARFPSCAAFAAAFAKALAAPSAAAAPRPPPARAPEAPAPAPAPTRPAVHPTTPVPTPAVTVPEPVRAEGIAERKAPRGRKGRGALVAFAVALAAGGAAFAAWGLGIFDSRPLSEKKPARVATDPRTHTEAAVRRPEPEASSRPDPHSPPATPFLLSVVAPAEEGWLSSAHVTVTGTVSEAEGASVTVNGVAAAVQGGRFTAAIDLGEGRHEIAVAARDAAGRTASATRTVRVKTTPPALEVLSPASGTVVAAREVEVSVRAEEGSTVTISGAKAPTRSGDTLTAAAALPREGENRIAVAATDPAGNASKAEVVVVRDTTPPSVRVAKQALFAPAREWTLEGTADDATTLTIGGVPAPIGEGGKFSARVTLPVEGENRIPFSAADRAGNTARGDFVVVRDTVPPEVFVDEPVAGASPPDGPVVVRGRVVDATPVTVRVNGTEVPVEGGRFEGRVTLKRSAVAIVADATDAAGNRSAPVVVRLSRGGGGGAYPGLTFKATGTSGAAEYVLDKDPSVVMVLVPAGEFTMGPVPKDPSAKPDEGPAHRVRLPACFVARTEVTWAQWDAFAQATGRKKHDHPEGATADFPASGLSWLDAKAWCDWAGLRLPTEEEWERAARGGADGWLFAWGSEVPPRPRSANLDDDSRRRATKAEGSRENWFHYDDGYPGLAPVARFQANRFGLYDVTGNVWEWCANAYREGEEPVRRVLRGGGFDSVRADCRLSRRNPQKEDFENEATGFRPAADAR